MNNAIFAARLWAALEGTPMGKQKRIITCSGCQQVRPHHAQGLCQTCYDAARIRRKPRVTDKLNLVDPLTRLPVPAMVRCAGAPGIACTRAARADVGRCWRCQQEAARAGVAA